MTQPKNKCETNDWKIQQSLSYVLLHYYCFQYAKLIGSRKKSELNAPQRIAHVFNTSIIRACIKKKQKKHSIKRTMLEIVLGKWRDE